MSPELVQPFSLLMGNIDPAQNYWATTPKEHIMLLSSPRIEGVVKQFPYRTARIDNRFLSLPRDEAMSALEHKLAKAAGASVDNHTVYEIVQDDEKPPVYIMFSDFTATFAHTLREGRW